MATITNFTSPSGLGLAPAGLLWGTFPPYMLDVVNIDDPTVLASIGRAELLGSRACELKERKKKKLNLDATQLFGKKEIFSWVYPFSNIV